MSSSALADPRQEATVATFLYDALLSGQGGLPEVQSAAAEFPAAAYVAEVHARGQLRQTSSQKRTRSRVTVSRVTVLPFGMLGARLGAMVARVLILVAALLVCGAILAGLLIGEGETPADRVLQGLFQINEGNIEELGAMASSDDAEWRHTVAKAIIMVDEMIEQSPTLSLIPERHLLWVTLVMLFVSGTVGGLIALHMFIAAAFATGFAMATTTAIGINSGLALVGGVNCEVTRTRRILTRHRLGVAIAPQLRYPTR